MKTDFTVRNRMKVWEAELKKSLDLGMGCKTAQSMFGAKIRIIDITLHTLILLLTVGFKELYITLTGYPDEVSM